MVMKSLMTTTLGNVGSQGRRYARICTPGESMRIVMIPLVVALTSCSVQPPASTGQATAPTAGGGTVTVRLSNFAFDPEQVRLKAGVLVRLHFVNESDGGHDFSAPKFMAASSFPPGSSAPADGVVEVAPHQTVEIALIPNVPGTYPFECTHFLHSSFGMHGTVEVIP
jgi:plastocyanin